MGNAIPAELSKEMDGNTLFHRFRYHLGSGFCAHQDTVLDLGSGMGAGTEILAAKARKVIAYDKEESNIRYAIKNHYHFNSNFKFVDIETIDLPKCDVACGFEVLEHLYKPKEFVEKLKKVVKKYIIVSVPLNQKLIMVNGDPQEEGDSTHHSVFTQQEFKDMFVDDTWKEFYTLTQGVTFIGVFYNKEGIHD